MKWGESAREYFIFNRRDRIAVLVLSILVLLMGIVPELIPPGASKASDLSIDTTWLAALKALPGESSDSGYSNSYTQFLPPGASNPGKTIKRTLFYFDPNTLDAKGWEKLGLPDKTIGTIQKYLSRGGHFYKAEDLSRIYGINEETFAALKPYIQISHKETKQLFVTRDSNRLYPERKKHRYEIIDINLADTSAFIALPGIGSKLASRIISFREKLGGFYAVEQVCETFGLADSSFQKLKHYLVVKAFHVRKINVNTASLEILKAHPYIRYAIANAIIAFRNEHGPFHRIEDIKK
ncbi:MAG TPA: helix-hairpin-helix domain-containing protein, partial [Chryseolinea sp.]|nr:helix-hairpin-helix domain-containing protein [Chryseolinea sp.]